MFIYIHQTKNGTLLKNSFKIERNMKRPYKSKSNAMNIIDVNVKTESTA